MNGALVWFTGLPASGKTTLARRVARRVGPAIVLDSDEMRDVLGMTDYSPAGRDAFYRALAALAVMLANQGHLVLVAATAPHRAHRDAARAAPRFIEVWVRASREECAARDIKGLYARANSGSASQLPGVGVAYEDPVAADVIAAGGNDEGAVEAIAQQLHVE